MTADDFASMTEVALKEALATCVNALKRIYSSDPGPAYYTAKSALAAVNELAAISAIFDCPCRVMA